MASNALDNYLRFPSGRTVGNCRKDAKKLAKQHKLAGLSLAKALDLIAEQNGLPGGWHKAVEQLRLNSAEPPESQEVLRFLQSLTGRMKKQTTDHKKYLLERYGRDETDTVWLPNGEGGTVKAYPHQGKGLLITEQAENILKADLELISLHEGSIELAYEVPGSSIHMAYSIQIAASGEIVHFCRCLPDTKEAELYAEGWSVRHVGFGDYKAVESMLHWTGFCFWRSKLEMTAYRMD